MLVCDRQYVLLVSLALVRVFVNQCREVVTRLTYGAYIVHPIVLFVVDNDGTQVLQAGVTAVIHIRIAMHTLHTPPTAAHRCVIVTLCAVVHA